MGLLTSTVSREIGRIEYMIKKYEQIRSTLPKGTICEKRLGKKRTAELLGDWIVKPEGAPVLAPADDKRPEIFPADVITKAFDE